MTAEGSTSRARAAVVVNPTRFTRSGRLVRFQERLEQEFVARGWSTPLWLTTTRATLGRDEARAALTADVDVVVVAGGDGTVRAVASALVGTDMPLGMLPIGTANLLARNLGLPLDLAAAVRVVCEGSDRRVSVGWLHLDRGGDGVDVERHLFVVMAGAGFDAAMMSGADARLKRRLGQAAYIVAGARAVLRPAALVHVAVDGRHVLDDRAQGMVVGNCGTLTMGLGLMPEADLADEELDAVVLLPRTLSDWVAVAWTVIGSHRQPDPLMPRLRGRLFDLRSERLQPVQVDGDVVGEGLHLWTELQPACLVVRCAAIGPRAARAAAMPHPRSAETAGMLFLE